MAMPLPTWSNTRTSSAQSIRTPQWGDRFSTSVSRCPGIWICGQRRRCYWPMYRWRRSTGRSPTGWARRCGPHSIRPRSVARSICSSSPLPHKRCEPASWECSPAAPTCWRSAIPAGCSSVGIRVPPSVARSSRNRYGTFSITARGPRPFTTQLPELTPARQRVEALADAWRYADGAVRLLEDRQHVRGLLASHGNDRSGRPTVIVRGAEDSLAPVRYIEAALDTAWQALGLGETKVRVAVVIKLARPRTVPDRPTPDERAA